ncbi:MAG: EAL domain-containing protein, partial [Alphaproteobacteria bacterium]|nr:EAL domain-containing protein [Alphaproteobacteria bacterium]
ARFITALRDLGCHVSLDDFGAGYTSFHHLKSLPVDVLKIDGSFIQGLPDNPDNQLFVRTMLGLAEGFGMKTVAECVETKAEAKMLKEFGVDYFQGYFFARPEVDALAQGQDETVGENAGGKAQGAGA